MKKSKRRCTSQRSWICVIPKKPELDKTFQKLQGTCGAEGIVRDDSGNCAVFTRQGSCITYDGSNSLRHYFRTAWRVITSERRCECAHATKKKETLSLNYFDFLNQIARCFGYGSHGQDARKVRIPQKAQSSHQNAIFMVSCRQDCYENENMKKCWWKKVGKMFVNGHVCIFPGNIA